MAALADQIAWAFRDEEQRGKEDRSGQRLHQIHPAPRGDPAPEGSGRAASRSRKKIIHEERQRQAGDDHDLLHGGHPPADIRRRDLGDIGRRQHTGRADRHAASDAGDHEQQVAFRQALDQRTGQEQHRCDPHHIAPSHLVGERARKERADKAADQQRTDREAQSAHAQTEGCLQPRLRAVDRATVIAEQ